jgi:DNA repair exonuclease SbcCD ATPase subunit
VQVIGAGGGQYKGASRGERGLVDLALLMGLGDLQGSPGLVWFDEVFDSLDEDNVDRVAAYLKTLSRDRQVVVVSHADALKARFPASATWLVKRDQDGNSTLQ